MDHIHFRRLAYTKGAVIINELQANIDYLSTSQWHAFCLSHLKVWWTPAVSSWRPAAPRVLRWDCTGWTSLHLWRWACRSAPAGRSRVGRDWGLTPGSRTDNPPGGRRPSSRRLTPRLPERGGIRRSHTGAGCIESGRTWPTACCTSRRPDRWAGSVRCQVKCWSGPRRVRLPGSCQASPVRSRRALVQL